MFNEHLLKEGRAPCSSFQGWPEIRNTLGAELRCLRLRLSLSRPHSDQDTPGPELWPKIHSRATVMTKS